MMFDYSDGERAVAAWRVLCDAGIAAVYRPDTLLTVTDDPVGTLWLAQRVVVPDTAAGSARALLVFHGLEPNRVARLEPPPAGRPAPE
jgi:hypothetical protein